MVLAIEKAARHPSPPWGHIEVENCGSTMTKLAMNARRRAVVLQPQIAVASATCTTAVYFLMLVVRT